MGQGQADVALATLRECSRNGDWVCLKNLHLVTAWLPLLEKVGIVCGNESDKAVLCWSAYDYTVLIFLQQLFLRFSRHSSFVFTSVLMC